MDFENQIPNWENEGTEPSDERKQKGFETGYKPPAGIFNWLYSLIFKSVKELQTKFSAHVTEAENPHNVTAEQIGLDKVNNTSDAEKSVKFASEAGVGRKVQYPFIVRLNGGETESTDLWTYDGAVSKSINLTPAKLGAAAEKHKHAATDIADKIVTATSTDGVAFTATLEGITKLYNGMEITIIPNTKSTSKNITLNLNELGAVPVRQPLSFSTFVATSPDRDYFLYADTPCRLMYHANYASGGIWLMADKQKTSAQDLYGDVPIESGGTGASNADDARANLGAAKAWAIVTDNATMVDITVADKTEYRFPNATNVTINAPSDATEYECWITIGGTAPTISFPSTMECVGIDGREVYSNITDTEISIKDGRYIIGCVGS